MCASRSHPTGVVNVDNSTTNPHPHLVAYVAAATPDQRESVKWSMMECKALLLRSGQERDLVVDNVNGTSLSPLLCIPTHTVNPSSVVQVEFYICILGTV